MQPPVTSNPRMLRLFYGVELAVETRRALERSVADLSLGSPLSRRLRWLNPEGWHLTLRFIGDVPAGTFPHLKAGLEATADRRRPFSLTLDAIEVFPSSKRPLVVAATGIPTTPAQHAVEALEALCLVLGLQPERRPWRPHVTLGRVRGRGSGAMAAATIDLEVRVNRLSLFESRPTSRGRNYVPIANACLEAP